jgi:SAM-dependent methyltransferase
MTATKSRPRLARLAERAAQKTLAAVASPVEPPPPPPEPIPPGAPARFERELLTGRLSSEQAGSTAVLYERLSKQDETAIEQRIRETEGLRDHYAAAAHDETARRHMILAFGIWLGIPSVSEQTGLPAAQPPEHVHAMARGATAAAGGLYEADLVVDALASAGVAMTDVHSALDFGCSSGRVVRVLAAAYPEVRWHGCDPNQAAIEWTAQSLPDIDFFLSHDAPPLPLADGSLDLVYAISIWSHFAPELGLRWFDEMHRLLRPGGHLVMTTHGFQSIAYYVDGGMRSPAQSREIEHAMYTSGAWYAAEFGPQGDWGVINSQWGTCFLSPEWVLTKLCPLWQVVEFAPGRNQANQDVYVLRRT